MKAGRAKAAECPVTSLNNKPACRNGRRGRLKICWGQPRAGSSPAAGIINDSDFHIIPVLKLIFKRISISKVRFFQLSFYHIRISGEGARVFP